MLGPVWESIKKNLKLDLFLGHLSWKHILRQARWNRDYDQNIPKEGAGDTKFHQSVKSPLAVEGSLMKLKKQKLFSPRLLISLIIFRDFVDK